MSTKSSELTFNIDNESGFSVRKKPYNMRPDKRSDYINLKRGISNYFNKMTIFKAIRLYKRL